MTNTSNPYKPFLRNVHVRRIFIIILWAPLEALLIIPLVALNAAWEELESEVPNLIRAFKDGKSYE
jgi:hypothetical protein